MIKSFSVGCSRTINLGNFESVRVEASITVDLDDDHRGFEGARTEVQVQLRKLLEETYRHQYADRKKIA